jgi:rhodanese-related sulfurtransferase
MPRSIDRHEVLRLLGEGAQLVEVLPADEYADAHITGAISIPLKTLTEKATRELSRERPIITYCHDFQ